MDFGSMMKMKQAWDTFTANHPKFPGFLNALRARGVREDDVIAVSITGPDGQTLETNIKVKASDLELMNVLQSMKPQV